MAACIFCDIVAGRSPASVVYRDDYCMAVMDICPINTGHLLVIPVRHATHLADLDPRVGSALFEAGQKLAAAIRQSDLKAEGINLLLADGEAAGRKYFTFTCTCFRGFRAMASDIDFRPTTGSGRFANSSTPMQRQSSHRWGQPKLRPVCGAGNRSTVGLYRAS